MDNTAVRRGPRKHAFPTGAFLFIVIVVCLGLALSAGYDYVQLSRLQVEYLHNIANEIATAIDSQLRGPSIRPNPEYWQELFRDSLENRGSSVAFLSLIDDSGKMIAAAGDRYSSVFSGVTGLVTVADVRLYVDEMTLPSPRMGQGQGFGPGPGIRRQVPRRLRIGIFASAADFIRWGTMLHLGMNAIAIATILALAVYFLRTLKRFLELQARDEAERHLTALGGMAATLAHEIRNPLGAMKGLTQLVQEDLPQEHRAQTLMNTVVGEAERLETLVTDLLTFARPRQPEISRFDFMDLVADVKTMLQPKLEDARIELEIHGEPAATMIRSDKDGCRQVLLNVILNAMDVTSAGGTIRVNIQSDDKNGTISAEIDDSGPGLGTSDPEEFFEPFATTKTKGTGLGLPISRRIVERLGGSLRLANRPEGGARCTLVLSRDAAV